MCSGQGPTIHSLLVIWLPDPSGRDATVTVVVTDRFNYSTARQKTVAAFKVPVALLRDDGAIEGKVAEALTSLSWDAMRTQARYDDVSLVIQG